MKSRRLKIAPTLDKESYRSLARWIRAGMRVEGGVCGAWMPPALTRRSVDPGAACLHDLAPARVFLADEGAELGRPHQVLDYAERRKFLGNLLGLNNLA